MEALIKEGKLQLFIRGRENLWRDLKPNQWAEGFTWGDKGNRRKEYNGWFLQESKKDVFANGVKRLDFLPTT